MRFNENWPLLLLALTTISIVAILAFEWPSYNDEAARATLLGSVISGAMTLGGGLLAFLVGYISIVTNKKYHIDNLHRQEHTALILLHEQAVKFQYKYEFIDYQFDYINHNIKINNSTDIGDTDIEIIGIPINNSIDNYILPYLDKEIRIAISKINGEIGNIPKIFGFVMNKLPYDHKNPARGIEKTLLERRTREISDSAEKIVLELRALEKEIHKRIDALDWT